MVTLTPAQKAKVAQSIRAQYNQADFDYVPGKVARARALRLVLQKTPETRLNRIAKKLKKALKNRKSST